MTSILSGLLMSFVVLSGEPEPEPEADAYFRTSYFTGSIVYEIQGVNSEGRWRSRLKFPINNFRVDCGASVVVNKVELSCRSWWTLDNSCGTLRDDDWKEDINDIWSRSDLDLAAWGLNCGMTYWTSKSKSFSIGPKLDISFDNFSYKAYNVRQWGERASHNGKVLTYDQNMFSILPGIASKWYPVKNIDISWDISATPLSYIWDEDDHILRSKVSNAEAMAWTFSTVFNIDYTVRKFRLSELKVGLNARCTYLESWIGEQTQKYYGGSRRGETYRHIDYSTTRENYLVGLHLLIHF